MLEAIYTDYVSVHLYEADNKRKRLNSWMVWSVQVTSDAWRQSPTILSCDIFDMRFVVRFLWTKLSRVTGRSLLPWPPVCNMLSAPLNSYLCLLHNNRNLGPNSLILS